MCVTILTVPALAQYGYVTSDQAGPAGGAAALAYASDGTLYVADNTDGTVKVIAPGGTSSILTVTGATLQGVGGMWVSPDDATLYITDSKGFGDGQGELYAVNVATGAATTLLTGADTIDDVAARSSGELFISEAVGAGGGVVRQVDPAGGGIVATPVTGLDYASGLAFDSAGDLIYQQATASFTGEVYRLPITGGGAALAFGAPVLLAAGLSAGMDLAVDSEDDIFVTGSGGLYELDRDAGGAFLGTATLFASQSFSTELAFMDGGTNPFEPAAGFDGPELTFVPEFASSTLKTVTTVPEPITVALLACGALAALRRRKA